MQEACAARNSLMSRGFHSFRTAPSCGHLTAKFWRKLYLPDASGWLSRCAMYTKPGGSGGGGGSTGQRLGGLPACGSASRLSSLSASLSASLSGCWAASSSVCMPVARSGSPLLAGGPRIALASAWLMLRVACSASMIDSPRLETLEWMPRPRPFMRCL